MQCALDQVLREARRAGAVRVHQIRLRVGVLSGVVPEALQFAFEALTAGTPAEGAILAIDDVPARFWCAPADANLPRPICIRNARIAERPATNFAPAANWS